MIVTKIAYRIIIAASVVRCSNLRQRKTSNKLEWKRSPAALLFEFFEDV